MTGKEIVLKAMRFEKTPRLPVAVLDGYVWMLRREGISFKQLSELEDAGISIAIRAFDDMQTDIVHPNIHCFNYIFEIMGGTVCCDKIGEAFEVTKPPLATMADIENYDVDEVLDRLLNKKEFKATIQLLESLKTHYGEERLVSGVGVGPFSLAGMLMGVQNFMLEIYEDEDALEKLMNFATEAAVRLCEIQIEHGAEAIMFAEPVASGDLISPAMFEELALPYIKQVTERLKKYQIPVMLHMCGHTRARLEPLKEVPIDGFSLAAVDLKEALDVAKGTYTIIGNLDPFEVMQSMTPEQVYQTCRELADIAGLEGGYIMMPGCDLPPAAPLENIQAMVKAAHDKIA